MDLFLAGDSIAVSGQPRVEFIGSLRCCSGRLDEYRFVGDPFNIRINAMHDDAFQVTYHPRGKGFVSQNSISQNAKFDVASKPHEHIKMEHSAAICFNHAEMIRNLSQDTDSTSIRAEEVIKDALTGVVEELGNCNRVRGCCGLPDGCSSGRDGVCRIFNAGQH